MLALVHARSFAVVAGAEALHLSSRAFLGRVVVVVVGVVLVEVVFEKVVVVEEAVVAAACLQRGHRG